MFKTGKLIELTLLSLFRAVFLLINVLPELKLQNDTNLFMF